MNTGELRPLVRLALPLMLVNAGHQVKGLVDIFFAGRIGPLAVAATGLGVTIFTVGSIFATGLVLGVDPIVSQSIGAGQPRQARRAMWQGVYAGLLMTIPLAGLVLGLGFLLERIGVKPELASLTRTYLFGRVTSLLPWVAFVSMRAYLQASHRTRPIVIAVVAAVILTVAGDWLLAFVAGLGVAGLGWASAIVVVAQMTIVGLALRGVDPGAGGEPLRRYDRAILGKVLRLGVPIGFTMLAEVGVFCFVGVLMARISPNAMAGHQVAMSLAAFTFMFPLAIGMATSVQVGRAIGRGDTPAARSAGIAGIALGAGVMTVCAVAMLLLRRTLASAMCPDAAVIGTAVMLLQIAAAFQIFDGIQAVATGALRGAGSTRWALGANVFAYWVVALPVGVVLGGPSGLWLGLTAGLGVAAAMLTIKFLRVSSKPIRALV